MNKLLKMELDFHRRNKNQLKTHISKLKAFKCFEDSTDGKLVEDLIRIYELAYDNAVASFNFYSKLKEDYNKPKDDVSII